MAVERSSKLPAREQRTAQRIYEALCLEGYTGAVDTVRRQMRAVERRRHSVAGAFIPQYFARGEAYQFDFSHEHVELGGIDQVVKLAHVRLCHSRGARSARAGTAQVNLTLSGPVLAGGMMYIISRYAGALGGGRPAAAGHPQNVYGAVPLRGLLKNRLISQCVG